MQNKNKTGFSYPFSIRPSPGKGQGVFIEANIPNQTIIWRHLPGLYKVFDENSFKAHLAGMSRSEVIDELIHMYGVPEFPDFVIKITDGGEMINHSRNPNLVMNKYNAQCVEQFQSTQQTLQAATQALLDERYALITTRDLNVGEELTLDYDIGLADPDYFDQLCEDYELTWPWL